MSKLLFLDTETTGLAAGPDKLLEVGCVVVSLPAFAVVAEQHWCFHFERSATPLYIHPKVLEMHEASGLWTECYRSQLVDYQKMDELVQRFIVDNGCQDSPLAGANPDFDRGFLKAFLPGVAKTVHYRNFDTNSLRLLREFITGEPGTRSKDTVHRALPDCHESIAQVEKHFDFMAELLGVAELNARIESLTGGN